MSTRKQSSNIGVRRQHPTSRLNQANPSLVQDDHPQSNKSASKEKTIRKPIKRRIQSSKREEPPKRSYGGRGETNTTNTGQKSQDLSIVSTTQQGLAPTKDSDVGSPPVLLVNPDLDLLPVVKTEQAKGAFDFYINSYATSIIEVSAHNIASYSNIVHQILYDELLFTAFTTVSEAARWRTQTLYEDPPLSVVAGYGKTITLLTKRLQSQRFAMSPTILLTMGQLVAIETLIKNVSATARHLAGMQAAMKPKSQEVAREDPAPVQKAVDIWTQYFMCRHLVKSQTQRDKTLTYPRHPFDPKMSMQIANLPAGFSDIALSGTISTDVLDLMDRFNDYFTKLQAMTEVSLQFTPEKTQIVLMQAAWCIEFHQIQSLTIIERLIVTALTGYVVRRDRIHPALVNMRNYYQITCAYLANLMSSPQGGLSIQDSGSDLVTWAGLLLLLTSSPEAHARKLALKLLPRRPEPLKLQQKSQQFFWDDDLTNALLSGEILISAASNDFIADNIKQALPDAEREVVDDT